MKVFCTRCGAQKEDKRHFCTQCGFSDRRMVFNAAKTRPTPSIVQNNKAFLNMLERLDSSQRRW